jgi:hypothetical protein
MLIKTFETGTFAFIPVLRGGEKFVVDNQMRYLIYRVPNYKNYITDDQLSNPGSCSDFLEEHDSSLDWKTAGVPLGAETYEFVGHTFRMKKEKVEIVGYRNLVNTMIAEKLDGKNTVILKIVN